MSQENVELFHKTVGAYSRCDIAAWLETAHPDIEWYPFTAQAEGGEAYRGHEGVRRWWSNLERSLDEWPRDHELAIGLDRHGAPRLRERSGSRTTASRPKLP